MEYQHRIILKNPIFRADTVGTILSTLYFIDCIDFDLLDKGVQYYIERVKRVDLRLIGNDIFGYIPMENIAVIEPIPQL